MEEDADMTPKGEQALRIVQWVYDEPDERAATGRDQLAELADGATGQELTEIQDAGLTISRLLSA